MENSGKLDTVGAFKDTLTLISSKKRKTALLLRAGGLGDILILTPIAKALFERGYDVDFFCGSPTGEVYRLIRGLPYFRNVKEISRIYGFVDCVKYDSDTYVSVEILKGQYDEVFDFKYSVEENVAGVNRREGWRATLNSNYQNWVDLSLAWANIDWTKISDDSKRPQIGLSPEEPIEKYNEWLETTPVATGRDYRVIGIQLQASSLIRSWYRQNDLPELIHAQYPDDVVLIFVGNKWVAMSKNGKVEIKFNDDLNPLICSMYLIKRMDAFIAADSGMSHVAEAVGTNTIAIYTTVPAWTRTKYYKYAHPLEASVACHPCFALEPTCPLERKKVLEELSEREKDIKESAEKGVDVTVVAKKYNTVPNAIVGEAQAIAQKIQTRSAAMPACVAQITPEEIMNKLAQVLEQGK